MVWWKDITIYNLELGKYIIYDLEDRLPQLKNPS